MDFKWRVYIQMSGRAGRQGIDQRGICILMVDEKLEPSTAKMMLKGSADCLNSDFHLSYNMLLNQMHCEDGNPENLLQNSFYQFRNQMVTTIEGLITQIGENLDNLNSFHLGDSITDGKKSEWKYFKSRLSKLLDIEEPWTLIIDDALARSFVSPVTDVIEDDHQLNFEDYERSWEQNEELGLNDIDTSAADIYYDDSKMSK